MNWTEGYVLIDQQGTKLAVSSFASSLPHPPVLSPLFLRLLQLKNKGEASVMPGKEGKVLELGMAGGQNTASLHWCAGSLGLAVRMWVRTELARCSLVWFLFFPPVLLCSKESSHAGGFPCSRSGHASSELVEPPGLEGFGAVSRWTLFLWGLPVAHAVLTTLVQVDR